MPDAQIGHPSGDPTYFCGCLRPDTVINRQGENGAVAASGPAVREDGQSHTVSAAGHADRKLRAPLERPQAGHLSVELILDDRPTLQGVATGRSRVAEPVISRRNLRVASPAPPVR